MPGPVNLAGVGAEVMGDDREWVILPMPVHEVAIERLRERGPERRMRSATVTRAERAVIERGIGLAGFAQDNDWRGKRRESLSVRRSGLDVAGLKGCGVRVAGARDGAFSHRTVIREGAMVRTAERGPTMPVAEWQAVEGRRREAGWR